MEMNYDPVFHYDMTVQEAEAYKIALLWGQEASKLFPRENVVQLPRKGDPRKSLLFRHCWVMLRETKGLLKPEEFSLYIHAQLFCMKKFEGYVGPNCLSGNRAWLRWKIWKHAFDTKIAERESLPPPVKIHNIKIAVKEILLTKKFLFEKCHGTPVKEKMAEFIGNGFLKMWILSGKVSPYYLILSPWIAPYLDKLSKESMFDPALARQKINSEVEKFFREEFGYEFS
jgi:hypothetical protein